MCRCEVVRPAAGRGYIVVNGAQRVLVVNAHDRQCYNGQTPFWPSASLARLKPLAGWLLAPAEGVQQPCGDNRKPTNPAPLA